MKNTILALIGLIIVAGVSYSIGRNNPIIPVCISSSTTKPVPQPVEWPSGSWIKCSLSNSYCKIIK